MKVNKIAFVFLALSISASGQSVRNGHRERGTTTDSARDIARRLQKTNQRVMGGMGGMSATGGMGGMSSTGGMAGADSTRVPNTNKAMALPKSNTATKSKSSTSMASPKTNAPKSAPKNPSVANLPSWIRRPCQYLREQFSVPIDCNFDVLLRERRLEFAVDVTDPICNPENRLPQVCFTPNYSGVVDFRNTTNVNELFSVENRIRIRDISIGGRIIGDVDVHFQHCVSRGQPVSPIPQPTAAPVSPPSNPVPVSPTSPAGPFPTQPTAPLSVRDVLLQVALFGGDEFKDTNTYQSKALAWLEQSFEGQYTDFAIIQRYTLACIYFATSSVKTLITDRYYGESEMENWINTSGWLTSDDECIWYGVRCGNNDGKITSIDLVSYLTAACWIIFLSQVKSYLILSLTHRFDKSENSLTGEFPPEIAIINGTLTHLNLNDNPMLFTRGAVFNSFLGTLTNLRSLEYRLTSFFNENGIPTEIGKLKKLERFDCREVLYKGALSSMAFPADMTQLTYLDISSNELSGTIPTTFAALTNIQELNIGNNKISGSLPDFFHGMRSLKLLNVEINELNGPLPTSIGMLSSTLQFLSLNTNEFTGTIPSDYSKLSNLRSLNIRFNKLSGTLPDMFENWKSLESLILDANANLQGLLPTSLGRLSNSMQVLEIGQNGFTGPIPTEYGSLSNIRLLRLAETPISGTLPDFFKDWKSLKEIYIFSTPLTGTLPASIGHLSDTMTSISFGSNNFVGMIPTEYGLLEKLRTLSLSGNSLSGSIPHLLCDRKKDGQLLLDASCTLCANSVPECCSSCS